MVQEGASLWIGIKKFEGILERDPQSLSFAPLAELYRKAGLQEDALAIARRGVALYPDFAAGQMALARIYLEKSMKQEGKTALESVVRITPENTEAQRLLATLYTQAGNVAAAEKCLAIAHALEPDKDDNFLAAGSMPEQPFQVSPSTAATGEISSQSFDLPDSTEEFDDVEEILDADILELTEYQEEEFDTVSLSPFAAAPERPSLQTPAIAPQSLTAPAEELIPSSPPVATATIAELYISQGFKDKGIDIYRELLLADPENAAYVNRINELTSACEINALTTSDSDEPAQEFIAAAPDSDSSSKETVETLEGWLSNIRRVKECRSENP